VNPVADRVTFASMNGATKTIWKTVVFAGAMLGTAACGGKKAEPTTPAIDSGDTAGDSGNTDTPDTTATDTADPCGGDPCAADPCADPCGGRPRGVSDEGETGRGFILS
jgi:hypothetical protein